MQSDSAAPSSAPITAAHAAERILAAARGAGETPSAADRLVAGDPALPVTGIATVAMASVEALRAAAAKRRNLIVSYDPTFWADGDQLDRFQGNRLLAAKRDFIRTHGLAVLDLHDGWARGLDIGMAQMLGWETYRAAPGQPLYRLPGTSLRALAKTLQAKLGDRTMRIVGDPALPVAQVAASWGNARQLPTIKLLNGPADVVICGYSHEWEAVMYAQDMVSAGAKKGLILLGEAKSVDGGMRHCAEWLRTTVREVPVDHLPAIEPYWNPRQPVAPARA
jgi:putative NIF3 family GTP cyclohydrolase 1 type 2